MTVKGLQIDQNSSNLYKINKMEEFDRECNFMFLLAKFIRRGAPIDKSIL